MYTISGQVPSPRLRCDNYSRQQATFDADRVGVSTLFRASASRYFHDIIRAIPLRIASGLLDYAELVPAVITRAQRTQRARVRAPPKSRRQRDPERRSPPDEIPFRARPRYPSATRTRASADVSTASCDTDNPRRTLSGRRRPGRTLLLRASQQESSILARANTHAHTRTHTYASLCVRRASDRMTELSENRIPGQDSPRTR